MINRIMVSEKILTPPPSGYAFAPIEFIHPPSSFKILYLMNKIYRRSSSENNLQRMVYSQLVPPKMAYNGEYHSPPLNAHLLPIRDPVFTHRILCSINLVHTIVYHEM